MTYRKQVSAKQAWAEMTERARQGEKFGFIACLGLLYKSGKITRAEVLQLLREAHVQREDCRKFRETR